MGTNTALSELVKKGIITKEVAADQAGMTIEEFEELINGRK